MNIVSTLKKSTGSAIRIAKDQVDKPFEYARITSDKFKKRVDAKIQEKALLNLKAELAMRHKSFDAYSDEELEIMLSSEKSKIIDDLKTKSLVGALALLGLDFLV